MTAANIPKAGPIEVHDLRGVPHAEVVIVHKDADGPGAVGVCYNTMGLPVRLSDKQFDEEFRALDPDALKAEFGGDAVWMNGPRRTQMDTVIGEASEGGKTTNMGGIPMLNVARLVIPDVSRYAATPTPYTETEVDRTTTWVFDAGKEVHELVAPNGSVYCMQSASLHVDPDMPEHLPSLGERLNLPDGWQYRVRTLDQELRVVAHGGVAHIVLDEYENNYQRED